MANCTPHERMYIMQVICKAMRLTTDSIITVTIPAAIGTDPYACTQWIGEEFGWQFIPMSYEFKNEEMI